MSAASAEVEGETETETEIKVRALFAGEVPALLIASADERLTVHELVGLCRMYGLPAARRYASVLNAQAPNNRGWSVALGEFGELIVHWPASADVGPLAAGLAITDPPHWAEAARMRGTVLLMIGPFLDWAPGPRPFADVLHAVRSVGGCASTVPVLPSTG